MNPMYGYRQMTSTDEVKTYLKAWHVPCLIEETPSKILVKVPEGAMRLSILVKCNTIPQLGVKLSFERMTFRELLRSLFA